MNQNNLSRYAKADRYYILPNGERQPFGPCTLQHIYTMVEMKRVTSLDFIYCDSWARWKPVGDVFNMTPAIQNVPGDDGQDPYVIEQALTYMEKQVRPGEQLHYIAVQHVPVLRITATVKLSMPKSIILTSQRFCVLEPRIVGEDVFDVYPVEYIESAVRHIKRGAKVGSFHIATKTGSWTEVGKIPLNQLERLWETSHLILSSTAGKPRRARRKTLSVA
ncbi:MAG: hypothetical protein P1V20_20415 [Verrucomicrobiales bacterium]|nr:hypothetical protein [Verrucomicrobiales bacterium]